MAKVKYDVSGVDHKKAREVVSFEQPTPGVYRCKVKEMNPGFSKGKDGKPDKNKPRVEVIFEIVDKKKFTGARLWLYLTFGDGYPKEKFSQFLQAFGVNVTKKSKGELDTDKFIGELCMVQVRKGTNQSGEYKAEVGNVMPYNEDDEDEDSDDITDDDDDDDVDDSDDDEEEEEEEEEDDDDEDEDEEDEEDEEPEDDYEEMDTKALRAELKSRDLETKGAKPALIARLREDDAGDGPF